MKFIIYKFYIVSVPLNHLRKFLTLHILSSNILLLYRVNKIQYLWQNLRMQVIADIAVYSLIRLPLLQYHREMYISITVIWNAKYIFVNFFSYINTVLDFPRRNDDCRTNRALKSGGQSSQIHVCVWPNSRFDSSDAWYMSPGDTEKVTAILSVGGMISRETGAEFRWKLRGKSVNYERTFNNESSGRSSLGRHHHLSCLLLNNRASAGTVLPAAVSTPFP